MRKTVNKHINRKTTITHPVHNRKRGEYFTAITHTDRLDRSYGYIMILMPGGAFVQVSKKLQFLPKLLHGEILSEVL